MFKKILIANRGEIALRILRACRELGIKTVAVFSEADRQALHVRYADEAYLLGPAPAREFIPAGGSASSKLPKRAARMPFILATDSWRSARTLLEACEAARIVFIGPKPSAIAAMGDKGVARATVIKAGVPVVPGTEAVGDLTDGQLLAQAPADRFSPADQSHGRRRGKRDA